MIDFHDADNHPANVLTRRVSNTPHLRFAYEFGPVFLREYEKEHGVTFVAVDNTMLEVLQEMYVDAVKSGWATRALDYFDELDPEDFDTVVHRLFRGD